MRVDRTTGKINSEDREDSGNDGESKWLERKSRMNEGGKTTMNFQVYIGIIVPGL